MRKKIKVIAKLRNTKTGYIRNYCYEIEKKENNIMHILYMWVKGNYSCDCNRSLFLYNWKREFKCTPLRKKCIIELLSLKVDGGEIL